MRTLVSKCSNYQKRKQKIMGRPSKFSEKRKEFIYNTAEVIMTIINKVSATNIPFKYLSEFNENVSESSVNNFL